MESVAVLIKLLVYLKDHICPYVLLTRDEVIEIGSPASIQEYDQETDILFVIISYLPVVLEELKSTLSRKGYPLSPPLVRFTSTVLATSFMVT